MSKIRMTCVLLMPSPQLCIQSNTGTIHPVQINTNNILLNITLTSSTIRLTQLTYRY